MMNKIYKLFFVIKTKINFRAALNYTFASVEHYHLLKNLHFNTIIDVGANKGQFSILGRALFPKARIFAFEPLEKPSKILKKIFVMDENLFFFNVAIGQETSISKIHISKKEDSSSIFPISSLQTFYFPGTGEKQESTIEIKPLHALITQNDIVKPALLKIDVQGYELEVLKGCKSLLNNFTYVFVECSFVELYKGQALTYQVLEYLQSMNFCLIGVYNIFYDKNGRSIQGDFMFKNNNEQ